MNKKKQFKEKAKEYVKEWNGVISEMPDYPEIENKYFCPLITLKQKQDIFGDQKNKFYEREKGKAFTFLKKCMETISRKTFTHQLEYLKNTPNVDHKLSGFNRSEAIGIYESVLK